MTGPPAMPRWDADQAVAVLYHAHYRALTRLAALLVIDVAAAEEIVQAAFAAMHGGWRHLRDSDKALAYLLRKVVIGARSHHAASPALPSRQPALPQARQPALTAPQALVAALHALPARQREALVLRCYAGLPDTQIAAAMGISARAVTGHIRRGLSSLQAAHSSAAPSSTAARNARPAVVRRFARPADLPGYGDQRTRGE
jgi:RNA polymerase sigma factor (sigma-70 family)